MTDFIFSEKRSLTVIKDGTPMYSLETAADLTGTHPDLIRHYLELGILPTKDQTPAVFDDTGLYRLRQMEHLRRQGIGLAALPMVLRLLQEVERLQAEIRFLRGP